MAAPIDPNVSLTIRKGVYALFSTLTHQLFPLFVPDHTCVVPKYHENQGPVKME